MEQRGEERIYLFHCFANVSHARLSVGRRKEQTWREEKRRKNKSEETHKLHEKEV